MRASFLLDPGIRFLNHGSFGACPREVLEAWHAWQLRMERNPVAFLARESAGLLAAVRARLGAFLGARPEDLILVPNATTAVNTVARSLELREGDEVLAPDMEYGACEAAWEWACARTGARYRRVGIPLPFEAEAFADTVWAAVTPRTRVLFLSHLCSATALVLPLEALLARARSAGILTVVDGAHAPGQLDLDLDRLGADFYTGNGHKWLCGPKGTAFLHARSEHHARLHAPVVSWGYRSEDGEAGHEGYAGNSLLEHRLQWQGTRDVAALWPPSWPWETLWNSWSGWTGGRAGRKGTRWRWRRRPGWRRSRGCRPSPRRGTSCRWWRFRCQTWTARPSRRPSGSASASRCPSPGTPDAASCGPASRCTTPPPTWRPCWKPWRNFWADASTPPVP